MLVSVQRDILVCSLQLNLLTAADKCQVQEIKMRQDVYGMLYSKYTLVLVYIDLMPKVDWCYLTQLLHGMTVMTN